MHEFAVCRQLLSQVEQVARSRQAAAVDRITVAAGPLSGIEPQLLQRAFSVARAGTVAADAHLEIETGLIRLRCRTCGAESEGRVNRLLCAACDGWRVDVLEGTELMLMRVELSGLTDSTHPTKAAVEASRAGDSA